ncbi:unnamed protein product, partial [Diplocarpon coronariae]
MNSSGAMGIHKG